MRKSGNKRQSDYRKSLRERGYIQKAIWIRKEDEAEVMRYLRTKYTPSSEYPDPENCGVAWNYK